MRTSTTRPRPCALRVPLALLLACALALPAAASAARPLKAGDRGARVAAVQKALRQRVDRLMGPATVRAVKRLQRRHGLDADGVVGPATWRLVKHLRARQRRRHAAAAPHRAAARTPVGRHARAGSRHARAGSRRARVVLLQRELGLRVDGIFGARTARAVRRYQRGHRMTADGIVGPATWKALGHGRVRTILRRARAHVSRGSLVGMPLAVRRISAAADRIASLPYRYGGGHGNWSDSGYDCSGSVSYALHGAGLLATALDSGQFMGWGAPGPGRWVTIYAKPSHAYMVIAGRRFDTSGSSATRWQASLSTDGGYVTRHPPGL